MSHTLPPTLLRKLHDSFDRQTMMTTFQARIAAIGPGTCRIEAPLLDIARQQHGAGHAALTFALGDTAAGYAALSLMPEGAEVMTAEIKINLLRPAMGERLVARAEVVRAGRRLSVVRADVLAVQEGAEVLIAILQGTMVPV